MVVGLYGEEAPKTVAAFLELAEGVCVCVCVCVCVEGCMEAGFLELLEGVCVCVCVYGGMHEGRRRPRLWQPFSSW